MVYVISSFQITPGKMKEAREHLQEHGDYLKKVFGKELVRLQPVTPGAGEGDRIISISTFDSLAAWGYTSRECRRTPNVTPLSAKPFRRSSTSYWEVTRRTVYTTI